MTHHFDEFGAGGRETGADAAQDLDLDCCQADCQDAESNPDCCSDLQCSGIQRDRFELLSAYLDGEVTASERRQVEVWLASDHQTQRLYSRLLTLRQGLQTLPITQSHQTVDQLVDQVTARVEQRPRRLAWAGLAAAGLLIGAVFGAQQPRYLPSVAERPSRQEVPSDGLMIALNHPPIAIPKASPVSAPAEFQKPSTLR